MLLPSRYWADLRSGDFEDLRRSGAAGRVVAVLPVAATEQHGPHLPLSVDTDLVDALVGRALLQLDAQVPVLVLPTQALGLSPEHAAFAGTITLKPETILSVWRDIGESVAAAGIHKLVLFNAHGGNVAVMDMVARDLRARLGMLVYSVSWFNLVALDEQGRDTADLFSKHEHRFGIHAGDVETSLMLAIKPERVNMAQAKNFPSTSQSRSEQFALLGNGKSAKLGWQIQDYNPEGAVGDASAATAEKGQALLHASAAALARLLAEVHQLPAETVLAR